MSPYRTPSPQETQPGPAESRWEARWDDRVLGCMLIAIGGVRVAIAIAGSEPFQAEATIAAFMVLFGLVVLLGR